jgi:hypothetical protein
VLVKWNTQAVVVINKTDEDDKKSSRKYTPSRLVPSSRALLMMSVASQKHCPFNADFSPGNR